MAKVLKELNKTSDIPKYISRGLLNIFGYSFYYISFLIPRKKDIWVFGSWSGKRFSDNSKYLFLHVVNNHKDISPIWISKNKDIIKKLREHKYCAYYAYELKGIYYNLRARFIFSDGYFDSVNFWCCGGSTKIQLWHGSGLKNFGPDAKNLRSNKPFIKYMYLYFMPWMFAKNEYITISSNFFIDKFVSMFRTKKDNLLITGLPRNDILFGNIFNADIIDTETYNKISNIKSNYIDSKLILYMPTFREKDRHESSTSINLDLKELNNFLNQINGFFIIKFHPNVKFNIDHDYERIMNLPSNFDIYPVFRHIDILVTDYSSIYSDFLLTDKPIIFYPYDLEEYLKEDRELFFNYQEYTPGPKAIKFEELLHWINYFVSGNDEFLGFRKKIRNLFFNYIDGKSSDRIYNFIKNL